MVLVWIWTVIILSFLLFFAIVVIACILAMLRPELEPYEKYHIANCLLEEKPSCMLTKDEIKLIKSVYPPFKSRKGNGLKGNAFWMKRSDLPKRPCPICGAIIVGKKRAMNKHKQKHTLI